MLFQSQGFILVFLPLALAAYYGVARSQAQRQYTLIAASLVFYGWWDARFIPLLLGQIFLTWLLSLLHARTGSRAPLVLAIALNLAALATFKYLDFLIGSVEYISNVELPRTHFILPIGISFFSFQLISYAVDRCAVMRRSIRCASSRFSFCCFLTLLPVRSCATTNSFRSSGSTHCAPGCGRGLAPE